MSVTYDLAGILAQMRLRAQDDDNQITDPGELEEFVEDGVNRYSGDRPRLVLFNGTGNGTKILALPTQPPWVKAFSVIREFEYPTGSVPRRVRDPRAWKVLDWLNEIHTEEFTVTNAEDYRIVHTARHTIKDYPSVPSVESPTATTTTIPVPHFMAVCKYSTAMMLRALASRYANTTESSFTADVVNYRSKSQEYSSLADDLVEEYNRIMHPDESEQGGAVVDVNFDLESSAGTDLLFHRRFLR